MAFASSGPSPSRGNGTPQNPQSSGSPGAPAIVPRTQGSPAFTADDVKIYYQSHSFSAGPTVSGAAPTITSIRFITSQQAQALMHGEFVGLPASAMVCYVALHGPFYPTLVSVPPGQTLPATVDNGFEVFDAHTGNLLLWGLA